MSKQEKLEALFNEWRKEHINESDESFSKTSSGGLIKKNFFQIDGIINEDEFEKEKVKVLFISAEANVKHDEPLTDYRQNYADYNDSGHDDWSGKMRERICGIYQYISKQNNLSINKMANKIAVMDINKRGGSSNIGKGKHIVEYAEVYKEYLINEIKTINPDLIVFVGLNLKRLRIHEQIGCINEGDKTYFDIEGKKVPVLFSLHTGNVQFQAKRYPPLEGIENKAIGILCNRIKTELDKYKGEIK